jgi:hypothetical protein
MGLAPPSGPRPQEVGGTTATAGKAPRWRQACSTTATTTALHDNDKWAAFEMLSTDETPDHANGKDETTNVGTLKDGYIHNVPLRRVPRIQSASLATLEPSRCTMVGNASASTYYLQVPRVPTWSDLTRSLSGFGRRTLLPFFPVRLM